jgi:hypothetical protein
LAQRDQVIAQQAAQLTTLECERSERQLARASAIDQAAGETNRLTRHLDRGIAAVLYLAALFGIGHAAAVELKLTSPYPFPWSAAILVTLPSAYHLIQDLRQRPKRGIDDALSGIASNSLHLILGGIAEAFRTAPVCALRHGGRPSCW